MKQHGDNFDNRLAQALRDRQPYVEDDGFTEQVMTALSDAPASGRLRPLFCSLLLALLAALLTVWLFPGWGWLSSLMITFLALPLMTLLLIGLGLGFGLALLTGLVIWETRALR